MCSEKACNKKQVSGKAKEIAKDYKGCRCNSVSAMSTAPHNLSVVRQLAVQPLKFF